MLNIRLIPSLTAIAILGGCTSQPNQLVVRSTDSPTEQCAQAEREIQLLESKLPKLSPLPTRSSSSSGLPPWMAQDSRNLNELRKRAISLDEEQKTRKRIETLKKNCEIP